MYGVGKVDRSGPARQRNNLALGGEDVYRVGEQIDLDVLKEFARIARLALDRSEEHTSELQSLMRISYAVFCLKKKHKQKQIKVYEYRINCYERITREKYNKD